MIFGKKKVDPEADLTRRILDGKPPKSATVKRLKLDKLPAEKKLPEQLHCSSLDMVASEITEFPAGIHAEFRLNLSKCTELTRLPAGLKTAALDLSDCTSLQSLPEGKEIPFRLNLSGCTKLTHLPPGLKTGTLNLSGCRSLTALPEDLDVNFLDISGCTALKSWPESARVQLGSVNAQGCLNLPSLPTSLGPLSSLNLSDCALLERLSPHLVVTGWLDLAGTKINSVPESLSHLMLRWRGVRVTAQVVFFPETLTSQQVLTEPNAEVRRVMIERFGLERLLATADAEVMDQDRDAGGPRRLLRVRVEGDEDLVCVSINCPSTGRHYLLRVPPTTRTCREGVAWTAGFDDPDDYRPLAES